MYRASVVTLVLVTALTGSAASDDKALEALQGKWKTVYLMVDGKEVPADLYDGEILTISGNERTVQKGTKVVQKAKFTLNPNTNPRQIDLTPTEGDYKGKT